MVRNTFWGAVAAVLTAGLPALAQDDYTPVCEPKGANGMVAMLLCPENLDHMAHANEGKAVCQDTKPCGAWIWTDASKVPETAPDAHDKLPKESIQAALAIWMNELDQLIVLKE